MSVDYSALALYATVRASILVERLVGQDFFSKLSISDREDSIAMAILLARSLKPKRLLELAASSVLPANLPCDGFLKLYSATDKKTRSISRLLLAETKNMPAPTHKIVRHIVCSGGKRLRARLVIASAMLLGYQGKDAITLGAAIEAIHCASLLHDDVVDGSKMRRGLPVAHNLWGAQASVLVGDFLFARAFSLMCQQKNLDILALLSQTAISLTRGEIRQLYSAHALDMREKECIQIIKDKTGALFRAATMSGAMLATKNLNTHKALAEFGEQFGIGFQLVDDMLDYVSESKTIGKCRGDDLRDGKITYPLALCIARVNNNERKRVTKLFGNRSCGVEEVEEVVALMQKYNCLNDCYAAAVAALKQGASAIDGVGETQIQDILKNACLASVERLS